MRRERMVRLHDEPTIRQNLDSRVSGLEVSVENIAAGQKELESNVTHLADRMDRGFQRLTDAITSKGQVNWGTIFAGIMLVVVLFGAGLTPLWIVTSAHQADINGLLPREVAAKEKEETETQFRGVSKELQTQVTQNGKDNDLQQKKIDELDSLNKEKLQRISKLEQRADDNEKYLVPRVAQHADMLQGLAVQVGKNLQAIDTLNGSHTFEQKSAIESPKK